MKVEVLENRDGKYSVHNSVYEPVIIVSRKDFDEMQSKMHKSIHLARICIEKDSSKEGTENAECRFNIYVKEEHGKPVITIETQVGTLTLHENGEIKSDTRKKSIRNLPGEYSLRKSNRFAQAVTPTVPATPIYTVPADILPDTVMHKLGEPEPEEQEPNEQ
jgi:hypothetical protein